MRTIVTIDDELLAKAQSIIGVIDVSRVVREALKRLIEQDSARRLARLGGTEPDLKLPHRLRSEPI